jgi:hypothetical protein
MTGEFLPPRAPGGGDGPPPRFVARPPERAPDGARQVVAARTGAPEVVQGEVPPRNTEAIGALGAGLGGIALLVLSVGSSFLVSLPCAILAIVLGRRGLARADAEGIGGPRAARVAIRLGWLGIVLCVAAAVFWVLVVVLDLDVATDVGDPSGPRELTALLGVGG